MVILTELVVSENAGTEWVDGVSYEYTEAVCAKNSEIYKQILILTAHDPRLPIQGEMRERVSEALENIELVIS